MTEVNIQDLRFLVVDDHHLMRQMVINQLQEMKFVTIDRASNGFEACYKLEKAREAGKPYNIIFLDWDMPRMNGFEVLTKCRADNNYDKTAIVMLTAKSEQGQVIQAIKAGATSYIVKPFSVEEFVKKFTTILEWLKK